MPQSNIVAIWEKAVLTARSWNSKKKTQFRKNRFSISSKIHWFMIYCQPTFFFPKSVSKVIACSKNLKKTRSRLSSGTHNIRRSRSSSLKCCDWGVWWHRWINANADFNKMNHKAMNRLLSFVQNDCLCHIRERETAKEIWESLQKVYKKSITSQLIVKKQFLNKH